MLLFEIVISIFQRDLIPHGNFGRRILRSFQQCVRHVLRWDCFEISIIHLNRSVRLELLYWLISFRRLVKVSSNMRICDWSVCWKFSCILVNMIAIDTVRCNPISRFLIYCPAQFCYSFSISHFRGTFFFNWVLLR